MNHVGVLIAVMALAWSAFLLGLTVGRSEIFRAYQKAVDEQEWADKSLSIAEQLSVLAFRGRFLSHISSVDRVDEAMKKIRHLRSKV